MFEAEVSVILRTISGILVDVLLSCLDDTRSVGKKLEKSGALWA